MHRAGFALATSCLRTKCVAYRYQEFLCPIERMFFSMTSEPQMSYHKIINVLRGKLQEKLHRVTQLKGTFRVQLLFQPVTLCQEFFGHHRVSLKNVNTFGKE